MFKISEASIAGLHVQDGKLMRNSPVRLLRDSVVVHEETVLTQALKTMFVRSLPDMNAELTGNSMISVWAMWWNAMKWKKPPQPCKMTSSRLYFKRKL